MKNKLIVVCSKEEQIDVVDNVITHINNKVKENQIEMRHYGIRNMETVLSVYRKCDIKGYNLSDFYIEFIYESHLYIMKVDLSVKNSITDIVGTHQVKLSIGSDEISCDIMKEIACIVREMGYNVVYSESGNLIKIQ